VYVGFHWASSQTIYYTFFLFDFTSGIDYSTAIH
jgi:hypothetical protein